MVQDFPQSTPFVQPIYDIPPYAFAARENWTTLRHASVEGVQQEDLFGPSFFASALPLILVTHVALHTRVAIRAYLDDVGVTGTLPRVCSILAAIAAISFAINLELNLRKCAWWLGLLPPVTGTTPTFPQYRWRD